MSGRADEFLHGHVCRTPMSFRLDNPGAAFLGMVGVSMNTNVAPPGGPGPMPRGGSNGRRTARSGRRRAVPDVPYRLCCHRGILSNGSELADLLSDIGAGAIAGTSTSDPGLANQMREPEALSDPISEQCGEI